MADGSWSQSSCRADVFWWGVPGSGCHYWTQRFGQYWVGGGVYQKYASLGWECGVLGPPVRAYGWVAEMNYGRGAYGQWFQNGAIGYHDGQWNLMAGDYGQTAGRLAGEGVPATDAEVPPDQPAVPTDVPAAPSATKPDRWVEVYSEEDGWYWRTMANRGNLPDKMVKASGPYRWKSSARRAAKRENPGDLVTDRL